MRFEDEIIDVLPLDIEHRKKWFSATGILHGLNSEEVEKTLELFNKVLDNWDRYKKYNISEYVLPMIRKSIHYLYSDESIIWSFKSDSNRLKVYRLKFNIEEYFKHFNYIFNRNINQFKNEFSNIDAEAELFNLCIKDYFTKLSNDSLSEDYISTIRDLNINTILNKNK